MFGILILLLFSFLFFLFSFYRLTKDDFLVLRKNIETEALFNLAFLTAFFSLFSARFFYAVIYGNSNWFNPLIFLAFTHVKGLSLAGGLTGGMIFAYFYLKRKKMPVGHLFDFLMISFLGAVFCGSLISFLFFQKPDFPWMLKLPAMFLILYLLSLLIHFKLKLKDGSLSLLFLSLFSLIMLANNHLNKKISLIPGKEDYLFIGLFIITLILFLKEEKIWKKLKRE